MGDQQGLNPFEDGTALGALRSVPSFEEALSRLLYAAEHGRPCGLLRGPAGTGKSALLECVMGELRSAGQECGAIDLRRTSAEEFAWRLASELGTAPACISHRRCWRLVEDAIRGQALSRRATVLIFDHLDASETEMLSELDRTLAIAEASAGWCTVLGAARSGKTALDRFLREHAELRIEVGPLDVHETRTFLHRVVELTGCCHFSDESVEAIHAHSNGRLKDLMTVCRLALLARSAEQAALVTGEIVRLVVAEVAVSPTPAPTETALLTAAE